MSTNLIIDDVKKIPDDYLLVDLDDFQDDFTDEEIHDVFYLIVKSPTGIFYTGQVGGIGCCHPQFEGYPIALKEDESINNIEDCKYGCVGIDEDDPEKQKWLAEDLDKMFEGKQYKVYGKDNDHITFKFDYNNISELKEAWWPVKFNHYFRYDKPDKDGAIGEWEIGEGIIYTCNNCDYSSWPVFFDKVSNV